MSSNPKSKNISKEYVDPQSWSNPERADIDKYFLRDRITVDKLIDEGRRLIKTRDFQALSRKADQLLNKLEGISPCCSPGLDLAVHTIVLVLKSARAKAAGDPLPKHLAEVGFAAGYFLEVYDLIPDDTPEIGLADDYAVLKRVLARNRTELAKIVILP